MLKTEIITRVKRLCSSASEDILKNALERLEKKITDIKGVKYESERADISADGFDDMYHAYLMSEVYMHNEDWDCHEIYDRIFQRLFSEFVKKEVRSTPGKEYKFPDWSWK